MRKTIKIISILALVNLLFIISCSDSTDAGNNNNEEYAQESAEAAAYTMLYVENSTTTSSALTNATSAKTSFADGDTIFSGCPTAVYYLLQKELIVDYGTGCTGQAGVSHSGRITLTGSISNGALLFSVDFDQYTAENYSIDGTMSLGATIDTIQVTITSGTVSDGNSTATIAGELKLIVNLNGTPSDPTDDQYLVTGNGTVTTPESKTYSFKITEALEFHAFCQFPVKGIIELTSDDKTASVDFSPTDNQCDDVVKVTVGDYEKTFSLMTLL
jgi:hypothetical protein